MFAAGLESGRCLTNVKSLEIRFIDFERYDICLGIADIESLYESGLERSLFIEYLSDFLRDSLVADCGIYIEQYFLP